MTDAHALELFKIQQLRCQYSHFADSLDLESFLDLFTQDIVLELDEKHGGTIRGIDQLRQLMEPMMQRYKPYEMFHAVSAPLIQLVDETTATGRWYLLDYNFIFKEEPFRVAGIYHDTYRKTEQGWKIAHSRLQFVYPYRWPED